jgi:hypothetical protein
MLCVCVMILCLLCCVVVRENKCPLNLNEIFVFILCVAGARLEDSDLVAFRDVRGATALNGMAPQEARVVGAYTLELAQVDGAALGTHVAFSGCVEQRRGRVSVQHSALAAVRGLALAPREAVLRALLLDALPALPPAAAALRGSPRASALLATLPAPLVTISSLFCLLVRCVLCTRVLADRRGATANT